MLECYLDIHNQWLDKCLVLLKKLVCFCICCFLYGFLIFIINGWINMLWCKSNCFAFSFFWFLKIFLTFRINRCINVWVFNSNRLLVLFVWLRTVGSEPLRRFEGALLSLTSGFFSSMIFRRSYLSAPEWWFLLWFLMFGELLTSCNVHPALNLILYLESRPIKKLGL